MQQIYRYLIIYMIDTSVFQGKKAAYYTLGCKLNFSETSTFGMMLAEMGVQTARKSEKADICLINTCSVTEVADHKCRQAIHRLVREHPGAFVVVTGCYAQLEPERISKIEGVDTNPLEITNSNQLNIANDCNKLIKLKGVELTFANGVKAFANPKDAGTNQTAVNRPINGDAMVLRTSTFAKFALTVMPQGKQDITGIASYYNGTWQLLMRTIDDIEPAK